MRERAGISQKALCERLDLDAAAMIELFQDLESDGLLIRRRDKRDGREKALYATAAGGAAISEGSVLIARGERRFFAALSAIERARLHDYLLRLCPRERHPLEVR